MARFGRDLKLCLVAVLVMAALVELHLAAPGLPGLRRLELVTLDLRFRLRGPQPPGPDIAIVMVDDATLAELGRAHVPRRKFAELLGVLRAAGAKVVALDFLFDEPEEAGLADEHGDEALAAAIRRSGNVVLPFMFRFKERDVAPAPGNAARAVYGAVRTHGEYRPLELRPSSIVLPIAPLADAAAALGHSLVLFDVDGSSRYEYPAIEYDLDEYPSAAMRVAQLFLQRPWPEVRLELGRGIALGTFPVTTDAAMRLGINYRGKTGTFPTYSFARVLAGNVPPARLRDRIVLVGANALAYGDAFRTPFTASLPGVERLATILDGILRGDSLRRPAYAPWLEALCMLAGALAIGLALARLSIAGAAIVFVMLLLAGEAAAQLAFARGAVWYAGAMPTLAAAITFVVALLYRYGLLDKDYRRVRRIFARYLSPAMVEQLAASGKFPALGGEVREISVLFCDLRGYSGIAERLEPQALTRVVNDVLTAVTEAVHAHGGFLDRYMGDAAMAFWNAPLDQPDHATLACRAALAIGERLAALNARRAATGAAPLSVGVGIATGSCTVGNFGSRDRHDYSAVGDAVNIAARLEGETKTLGIGIVIGPETASRVRGFAALPLAAMRVRGRTQPIEVAALIGDESVARDPAFAALRRKHDAWREAASAQDRERAAALAVALGAEAPAGIKPLYAALAARRAE